ncbi:MAG: molybdenum cofactor synthesis domain-containing protein [Negativicutes bacterium]|jgi:molybdenum cofactor synthesis domain-containing protein
MNGEILSINISKKRGTIKTPVNSAELVHGKGIVDDAHFGFQHRQVSFLAQESVDKMPKGLVELYPGIFAENITTSGIVWSALPVGCEVSVGTAKLRITQIGKECHDRCAVYETAGDCVMPREGVFAEVLTDGIITVGDTIMVVGAYKVGVLVTSDRCASGVYSDSAGLAAQEMLQKYLNVTKYLVVADEISEIGSTLVEWTDNLKLDLIITCGGTGLAPRDVTVDATLTVMQKNVPGISELLRARSLQFTPFAALSRGVSGIRNNTLIINLPGSEKAVRENLEILLPLLPHALKAISGEKMNCGAIHEN